jgi:hypothetical protein
MYIDSSEPDETGSETAYDDAYPECANCTCCARGQCKADGMLLCVSPTGNQLMPWWECPCALSVADKATETTSGYVIVLDPEDGSPSWITHGTLERPLSLRTATSLMNFRTAVLRQNHQPGKYTLREVAVRLADPAPDTTAG